jgi:hypothetical protein
MIVCPPSPTCRDEKKKTYESWDENLVASDGGVVVGEGGKNEMYVQMDTS